LWIRLVFIVDKLVCFNQVISMSIAYRGSNDNYLLSTQFLTFSLNWIRCGYILS